MHNAPSPPLVLLTALCETEKCDEEKIGFDQEPIFTQPTIAGLWNSKVCWIHCSPQTDGQEVVWGEARDSLHHCLHIYTHKLAYSHLLTKCQLMRVFEGLFVVFCKYCRDLWVVIYIEHRESIIGGSPCPSLVAPHGETRKSNWKAMNGLVGDMRIPSAGSRIRGSMYQDANCNWNFCEEKQAQIF